MRTNTPDPELRTSGDDGVTIQRTRAVDAGEVALLGMCGNPKDAGPHVEGDGDANLQHGIPHLILHE